MSTTTTPKVDGNLEHLISQHLDKVLPKKFEEIEANRTPSMAIIATKGTLDWAYPRSYSPPPARHSAGMFRFSSPSTHSCS